MTETYRLCSEQLSYQHHYEFGMRALKATLNAAQRYLLIQHEVTDEFEIILRCGYKFSDP